MADVGGLPSQSLSWSSMLQRLAKTPRLAWADQAVLATLAQLKPQAVRVGRA